MYCHFTHIRWVGDELSEEDLFVGVEGVNDKGHKLSNLSLECEGLNILRDIYGTLRHLEESTFASPLVQSFSIPLDHKCFSRFHLFICSKIQLLFTHRKRTGRMFCFEIFLSLTDLSERWLSPSVDEHMFLLSIKELPCGEGAELWCFVPPIRCHLTPMC